MKTCSRCHVNPALPYHAYCYACLRISRGQKPAPKFRRDSENKTMCCKCKQRPRAKGHGYCVECRNESVRRFIERQGGSWNYIIADNQRHQNALARQMVANRVKRGKMEKKPCEVCGNPKSESHHDDYSKPLAVRWLCQTHHTEADRKKKLLTE